MWNAGSAYIYERNGNGNWIQVQKIVASDREMADEFGSSVSISGNYAIIGAMGQDKDTIGGGYLNLAGAVYIFERNVNGNWNQMQKLVASDRDSLDGFGSSVSISGDYAIVGAYLEDEDSIGGNNQSNAGSAYIINRDINGNWSEVQKIVASDRDIDDNFGYSASINGNYCLIGACHEDEDINGSNTMSNAGSAYIFEKSLNGYWNQVKKINASDRDSIDRFGCSVSISGDYAIVGADLEDEDSIGGNTKSNAGSAYLFERDSSGNWVQMQKIDASDRFNNDYFGSTVCISNNTIIVGAPLEAEDAAGGNFMYHCGSAYIFEACNVHSYISPNVCNSYTSPSSNYVWTTSGTYLDTILNSAGCDSIITINLTIYTVDTSVTQTGIILTANASTATYQWLDCNNGNLIIAGATNQSFTPIANGSYAVEITENTCVDTSACFSITGVGIIENDFGNSLKIYPNPSKGKFTIETSNIQKNINVSVFSVQGKEIIKRIVYSYDDTKSSYEYQVDLSKSPKGIYFIRLWNESFVWVEKVVLQ